MTITRPSIHPSGPNKIAVVSLALVPFAPFFLDLRSSSYLALQDTSLTETSKVVILQQLLPSTS
jgi:hypothetical protein